MSLALICALAAGVSLTLTGCDASPYAASVNGQVISQTSLNSQLKKWAGNRTWVASYNRESSQPGASGATVQGAGGPGTYSSGFVADILGNLVDATIIHQHLAATGNLPGASEMTASRAVNELLRSDYWAEFPQSLRTAMVQQLADEAALVPLSTDTATLREAYGQIQPYLFSRICVVQAAAADLQSAKSIAASGKFEGSGVCFDQLAMEDQPAAYKNAVMHLKPGEVSKPIKTGFGYQVVRERSRDTPGFDQGVKRVLSAALATQEPPSVAALVSKASVKVNPVYGTWDDGTIKTRQPVG